MIAVSKNCDTKIMARVRHIKPFIAVSEMEKRDDERNTTVRKSLKGEVMRHDPSGAVMGAVLHHVTHHPRLWRYPNKIRSVPTAPSLGIVCTNHLKWLLVFTQRDAYVHAACVRLWLILLLCFLPPCRKP